MSRKPVRLAIVGHPIGHSLSPLTHTTALQAAGLQGSYVAVDVTPDELHAKVLALWKEGYRGFNVTIPHKQAILPMLHTVSRQAAGIGAVNAVVLTPGRLRGENTDVEGVVRALDPVRTKFAGRTCLVLGSGGAARAVCFALKHIFGVSNMIIATRTVERGMALSDSLGLSALVHGLSDEGLASSVRASTLLINTTPVGMYPNVDGCPLPEGVDVRHDQTVFDLIYRPWETILMRRARAAGATIVTGVEMFLHQAAAAFHLWTGQAMPMDPVRSAVMHVLEQEHESKERRP